MAQHAVVGLPDVGDLEARLDDLGGGGMIVVLAADDVVHLGLAAPGTLCQNLRGRVGLGQVFLLLRVEGGGPAAGGEEGLLKIIPAYCQERSGLSQHLGLILITWAATLTQDMREIPMLRQLQVSHLSYSASPPAITEYSPPYHHEKQEISTRFRFCTIRRTMGWDSDFIAIRLDHWSPSVQMRQACSRKSGMSHDSWH
ncbi:uncharacterized protein [Miscanthus floridulus]|uniref:uncharacterized protein isoform X3 n=1 Tax=Miscanthus floridulus TaxID=154761 RepID=UPI00345A04A5